jgi:hypothetical protein
MQPGILHTQNSVTSHFKEEAKELVTIWWLKKNK